MSALRTGAGSEIRDSRQSCWLRLVFRVELENDVELREPIRELRTRYSCRDELLVPLNDTGRADRHLHLLEAVESDASHAWLNFKNTHSGSLFRKGLLAPSFARAAPEPHRGAGTASDQSFLTSAKSLDRTLQG